MREWRGEETPWSVTRALAVRFGGTDFVPPAALERGTLVHEWTADIDQSLDAVEMPKGLDGYCSAYRDFRDIMQPAWLKIESPVEHEHLGYHGVLDRIGWLNGDINQYCVADIKTGRPREADRYQLAAYAMAAEPDRYREVKRVGIYIRPDGLWSLKSYSDNMDYQTWIQILKQANETKERRHGTRTRKT
jgi:hypothetical protein